MVLAMIKQNPADNRFLTVNCIRRLMRTGDFNRKKLDNLS